MESPTLPSAGFPASSLLDEPSAIELSPPELPQARSRRLKRRRDSGEDNVQTPNTKKLRRVNADEFYENDQVNVHLIFEKFQISPSSPSDSASSSSTSDLGTLYAPQTIDIASRRNHNDEEKKEMKHYTSEIENLNVDNAPEMWGFTAEAQQLFEDGLRYYRGDGTKGSVNWKKAFQCFSQAGSNNHDVALLWKAICLYSGIGVPYSVMESTRIWREHGKRIAEVLAPCVEAKDPGALTLMGWMCFNGFGGSVSYDKAARCYLDAAAMGHGTSLINIAVCYWHGFGVALDREKSMQYYHKAADQGQACAFFNLGWSCINRIEYKDIEKGVQYYRKAAEQGHPTALMELGWIYWNGLDTVQSDIGKALSLFEEAADRGCIEIADRLPSLYDDPRLKSVQKLTIFAGLDHPTNKETPLQKHVADDDRFDLYLLSLVFSLV